jgi:hypothetical protein
VHSSEQSDAIKNYRFAQTSSKVILTMLPKYCIIPVIFFSFFWFSCNSQKSFFIANEDIGKMNQKNDSVFILPAGKWFDRNLFKVDQLNNIKYKKDGKAYIEFNSNKAEVSLYDSTLLYFEYRTGANQFFNFNIGDPYDKIIDPKLVAPSNPIRYLQIGVPYAGNSGFEFTFIDNKLVSCVITNFPD